MKKNIIVIALCFVCAIAFVTSGICQDNAMQAKAPVKVNNTVCPVMGDKINMNDPVTVEYNGKVYNLCCSMCVATFKANPEKYSKIAEEQAKSVGK